MTRRLVKLQSQSVRYRLRRSQRARHMRLTVYPGGSLVVTAPVSLDFSLIEQYLHKKTRWILEKVQLFSSLSPFRVSTHGTYLRYREQARTLISQRLEYWNTQYGFSYVRVSIKDHKSIWGSCSRKRNLNFNYRLLFLPKELADYVVVHELCHLKEQNHSKSFWLLLCKTMPNYGLLREKLKHYKVGNRVCL